MDHKTALVWNPFSALWESDSLAYIKCYLLTTLLK